MTPMTTPRKATPAKAAKAPAARAKKPTTTRKPAAAAVAVVDEETPEPAGPKTVTLAGRPIEVNQPTAEQVLAWERSLAVIGGMDEKAIDFERMNTAVDHFYEVTGDLFVHDADREWLAMARRRGLVSIQHPDTLNLVATIGELYKDEMEAEAKAHMNRAQKRAAARKKS